MTVQQAAQYMRQGSDVVLYYMSRREFPMQSSTKFTIKLDQEEMYFLRDLVRIGMKSKYFVNYSTEEIDDYECEDIRMNNVLCAQQFVNLVSLTHIDKLFDDKLFEGVTV